MLDLGDESCLSWAHHCFSLTDLGDRRRTRRLISLAAAAAASPAGKITQVLSTSAERQGAYDWLHSSEFSSEQVRQGLSLATVSLCQGLPWVWVPLDQTSLRLTDYAKRKDFGPVAKGQTVRGLQVMSALAVAPNGTPIGLCAQSWWARPVRRPWGRSQLRKGRPPKGPRARHLRKELKRRDRLRAKARHNRRRAFSDKEPHHWVQAAEQVCAAFKDSETRPWLQCDRGADNQDVLVELARLQMSFTVRAKANRRLDDGSLLQQHMALQPVVGHFWVEVPARRQRPARQAWLQVRWSRVTLQMRNKQTDQQRSLSLWVVQVREKNTPKGQKPLHWTLLTSEEVKDEASARRVVSGYEARWRIEEMHRAWKRGGCRVEESELRTQERVKRWGTVLAAVATRITRLTYLAREQPEEPAESEFSEAEMDAAILLRRPPGWQVGQKPTLGQMVRWVADVGGYTGKSSGGPPGATVIGRGMERVKAVAKALESAKELGLTLAREKR